MTSSQLMQQAKELEKEEKEANELKEMNQLIEAYTGKCFGTSKFRQKAKSTYHAAIHIHKIEKLKEHKHATAEGTIVCYYTSINVFKDIDWRTNKQSNIRYSVANYTTNLNNGRNNMFSNMHDLINGMKEIPYATFYELYNIGEVGTQLIEDAFNGKIVFEVEKTIGDSGNQSRFEESCTIAGIKLIDLEKHLPLLNVIKYAKLPGYVEDRFLMQNLAKIALETQIKLNNKEMQSHWCDHRRYASYERDNKILNEYIIKLNL
jgi:hypothetical protein